MAVRPPLTAAQDKLTAAAEAHVARRRGCPRLGCAECASLARTVLRWMGQAGMLRFGREEPEDRP